MTEREDKNNGITAQSKPHMLRHSRKLTNDCPAVNKYSLWIIFPLQLTQLSAT